MLSTLLHGPPLDPRCWCWDIYDTLCSVRKSPSFEAVDRQYTLERLPERAEFIDVISAPQLGCCRRIRVPPPAARVVGGRQQALIRHGYVERVANAYRVWAWFVRERAWCDPKCVNGIGKSPAKVAIRVTQHSARPLEPMHDRRRPTTEDRRRGGMT
jgi:hypothetical protein